MTVRDDILQAIVEALTPLSREVEVEPTGDPSQFPGLAVYDDGHIVIEREFDATRYRMGLTVEGYVEGGDGFAPTRERNALHAGAVAALMADDTLGGLVELIEDGELRFMTATLSDARRLAFRQSFDVQFVTQRRNPALPA